MKGDNTYHVGDTIFVRLFEVREGNVVIKEVAPNRVNLFTVPTEAFPESKLFLKDMKAFELGESKTINKTKLQKHIKTWWNKNKQPFTGWLSIRKT